MKKNKGFTLVEVLGVIVLLSIVFLISYTTILNTIKKSQDDIDSHTLSLITSATKDYMADRKDNYPEVNKNVFCIDINDLTDNNYIDEDTITAQGNSILSKTVKVTYKNDNNSEYEVVGECSQSIKTPGKPFVNYLLKKTNDLSVTKYQAGSEASHQMYTFDHPATEQTEGLTDYRYIGNNPYNYVYFNCDDNEENCEIWRIVGVFTVENESGSKEQRIKLIKVEGLDNYVSWDLTGVNEWSNSTLNAYLNGEYYNNGLTDYTKLMIEPAKYYLSALIYEDDSSSNYYNFTAKHYGTADVIYTRERGIARYDENRSLNWVGNIGLLYPSDYIYMYANGVENICYNDCNRCGISGHPNNGWIRQSIGYVSLWLLSPIFHDSYDALFIYSRGDLQHEYVKNRNKVCPVVYLKSNVKIVDGDGTQSNPYKLSL